MTALKRDYEAGYSVLRLSAKYRLARSVVQRQLIAEGVPLRRTTESPAETRERAIAELLADGCDPEIVAANFGAIT